MTIDEFTEEFGEAIAGLAGSKLVKFKVAASKTAGEAFDTIDSIQQIGEVINVYPDPNGTVPAHVLITFA